MEKLGALFRHLIKSLKSRISYIWFAVPVASWCLAFYLIQSKWFTGFSSSLNENALKNTASLGDSFGSISALMASLAAVGAILALSEQRSATRRSVFISTFTSMMDRLQQVVQDTDYIIIERVNEGSGVLIEQVVATRSGQKAFYELAQELRIFIQERAKDCLCYNGLKFEGLALKTYEDFFEEYKDDLGHYFRQVYHILLYVHESQESDKQRFARVLRAACTNSQLLLLGYNTISGEGRIKFTELIRNYSMLHNLGFEADALGKLERDMILDRVGKQALTSRSQAEDFINPEFKQREKRNVSAKDAFREHLLANGLNTDIGGPWVQPLERF
ncbi:putative phage abortive infection protein [uncultured Novosphingobium sp.]|uniref:putative phage abortive infection protein n=1 Tax=uncultured Novosphingobium sp. TaxID=292277 RepID=UPI003748BC96